MPSPPAAATAPVPQSVIAAPPLRVDNALATDTVANGATVPAHARATAPPAPPARRSAVTTYASRMATASAPAPVTAEMATSCVASAAPPRPPATPVIASAPPVETPPAPASPTAANRPASASRSTSPDGFRRNARSVRFQQINGPLAKACQFVSR